MGRSILKKLYRSAPKHRAHAAKTVAVPIKVAAAKPAFGRRDPFLARPRKKMPSQSLQEFKLNVQHKPAKRTRITCQSREPTSVVTI